MRFAVLRNCHRNCHRTARLDEIGQARMKLYAKPPDGLSGEPWRTTRARLLEDPDAPLALDSGSSFQFKFPVQVSSSSFKMSFEALFKRPD